MIFENLAAAVYLYRARNLVDVVAAYDLAGTGYVRGYVTCFTVTRPTLEDVLSDSCGHVRLRLRWRWRRGGGAASLVLR